MPRGTKFPSEVFRTVLAQASAELQLGAKRANAFQHRGIRGDERAAALGLFLRQHLPLRFGIGKGEGIDHLDNRTGELDLIVYDAASSAAISLQAENLLLPCEAMYAVIEVKSVLNKQELEKAYAAAAKVRALRPFKSHFVPPRQDGVAADDDVHRCVYLVFAYSSDLVNDDDWLQKEYGRAVEAAARRHKPIDCVDRIVVLDRGMINPAGGVGKKDADDGQSVFLESYLHLVNFLTRESSRRPSIDWQMYGPRSPKGWKKLRLPSAAT